MSRPDVHLLAARYVVKHAGGSPAGRRDLLDALGLIDGTGRGIVPAPVRDRTPGMEELSGPATSYVNGERDTGRWQDDKVRPRDLSLVPAGLRDYVAPVEVATRKRSRGRRNVLHDGQPVQPEGVR